MGSALGETVNPVTIDPTVGKDMQQRLLQALFGAVGVTQNAQGYGDLRPLQGYTGQLSPTDSQHITNKAAAAWQPWDGGMQAIADTLYGTNGLKPGTASPYNTQQMQWGGTGGPGNQAMASLSQYGVTGPGGAGKPLQDLAQGYATGPAAWLAPWLTAGKSQQYASPQITLKPITRTS